MVTYFEMPRINDMHVHFRQGTTVEIAKFHNPYADHVLVMPNLTPPITTGAMAMAYEEEILRQAPDIKPLMAIYLNKETTPQIIREAKAAGVTAAKLYPDGVTTNSGSGIHSLEQLAQNGVLDAMQDVDMVFSIHPEEPGRGVLHRESRFLGQVRATIPRFKGLRVVLEHITTQSAVGLLMSDLLVSCPRVAATITPHHLLLTLDDIIGDKLEPRNFCKPVAKLEYDRDSLLDIIGNGNPHFFLGSDSAPHRYRQKCCDHGCAGVFTAPILPGLLAQIFHEAQMPDRLADFASNFGADFYGVPRATSTIKVTNNPEAAIVTPLLPQPCFGIEKLVWLDGEVGRYPVVETLLDHAYPVFMGPEGFNLTWWQTE